MSALKPSFIEGRCDCAFAQLLTGGGVFVANCMTAGQGLFQFDPVFR